ncbi:hypothetical protein COLO4_03430 [Corchorus olitorius]|uniref:Increased DNA methylation 1 C-terminal domain-containing protein n=1 Tax=Corchorus olitorius TaxID=93759 RepID=A0A1R3KYS1_9ROSI|nr:hypothetical protein COLO4_03430 [Corchorus olitorius]
MYGIPAKFLSGIIVCAATVRVHDKNLAEMPYIATSEEYRGSSPSASGEACRDVECGSRSLASHMLAMSSQSRSSPATTLYFSGETAEELGQDSSSQLGSFRSGTY